MAGSSIISELQKLRCAAPPRAPLTPSPSQVVVHVRDGVHRRGAAQRDQEHERGLDDHVRDAEVAHAVLPVLINSK